ncbi:hypothetical protein BABINDRAFT_163409 [Babjeviella inositovora NRRL Y-12698]|uniref:Golgi to ER traffic protein 1 n=1 Tax=Babjeviella inositovora NRRL Y-12698 TaxID=984486 RepID=A0A1E3QJ72_9ASCO|nr:uncharacterized protein BABINDRAFT_163409 [Babjeviella inositovora NRRL Y-12698]ODQ77700.1 hypothetical protein BABINDRAFT_163409 [Babjeviella inositovora NRRL Y-12698]
MQSYTLVITVLFLLLAQLAVKLVTKDTIQKKLWAQYVRFSPSSQLKTYQAKAAEIAHVVKEKNAISPQDHYARWTKLNRQFDKLTKEKAELESELATRQAQFAKYVSYAITASITAPLWFFRYQYRKQVFFYIERGVFPAWIDWCLALPFMATGCVGLTIWSAVVKAVLGQIEVMVRFMLSEEVQKPVKVAKVEEVK